MPRDRYLSLLKMLHFDDNDNPNQNDKLFKIRLLLDHLRSCLKISLELFQNVYIDQSFMLFKGQILLSNCLFLAIVRQGFYNIYRLYHRDNSISQNWNFRKNCDDIRKIPQQWIFPIC